MEKPKFFNANCLYYPDNVFFDANEVYLTNMPKSYENKTNNIKRFYLNDLEIEPSNEFKQLPDGRWIRPNDAKTFDGNRYQVLSYDAPPLDYNSDILKDYYRAGGGNQLGFQPTYSSLDTGHDRFYVNDFTMTPYNDTNYTIDVGVQRTLMKYPNGTLVPYYRRTYKKDFMEPYEGTSDFLKNSAYFREDFMEIRSRDMNARDYSLNYFY